MRKEYIKLEKCKIYIFHSNEKPNKLINKKKTHERHNKKHFFNSMQIM